MIYPQHTETNKKAEFCGKVTSLKEERIETKILNYFDENLI